MVILMTWYTLYCFGKLTIVANPNVFTDDIRHQYESPDSGFNLTKVENSYV